MTLHIRKSTYVSIIAFAVITILALAPTLLSVVMGNFRLEQLIPTFFGSAFAIVLLSGLFYLIASKLIWTDPSILEYPTLKTKAMKIAIVASLLLGLLMTFATETQKREARLASKRAVEAEQVRRDAMTPEEKQAELDAKKKAEEEALAVARKQAEADQLAAQKRDEEAEKEARRLRLVTMVIPTLKKAMRDPDSFSVEEALVSEDGKTLCVNYRSKNGFGGMNQETIVLMKGKALQDANSWKKHCTKGMSDLSSEARFASTL